MVSLSRRVGLIASMALIVGAAPACAPAQRPIPPQPDWQTGSACQWQWLEGGNIGLWAESCEFATGHWQIAWSTASRAFELQWDEVTQAIVVQDWHHDGSNWQDILLVELMRNGHLPLGHDCSFQPFELRPGAAEPLTYQLQSAGRFDESAPDQVPEDRCGRYGYGTHGVRYFMRDARWPRTVIFVNEGQERPMFDVSSIRMIESGQH